MTRGPVPEFSEVRQSTVDPDNDVLLRIVEGLQQYFTKLLLGASFPDLCHKAVLRQRKATSLVFKCAHDSLVGRSPEGEERELSPHLVADCGKLWKGVVSVKISEQMKRKVVCPRCTACLHHPTVRQVWKHFLVYTLGAGAAVCTTGAFANA